MFIEPPIFSQNGPTVVLLKLRFCTCDILFGITQPFPGFDSENPIEVSPFLQFSTGVQSCYLLLIVEFSLQLQFHLFNVEDMYFICTRP